MNFVLGLSASGLRGSVGKKGSRMQSLGFRV